MRPPLLSFCDARQTMSRIVLKFCIAYGTFFAQLLVEKHGAVASQEVQGQTIFARSSGILHTFKGNIDLDETGFDYFRSEVTCMTPPLIFWSRSGQSQGQGQASDLG